MNDRSTPEPIELKLLEAVERICAHESPSTVSMRTIAAEANCSLGVAYNYFESKDDLIGATLDRLSQRMAASGRSTDDPYEALVTLWDTMEANPAFGRLVTWLVLEGRDVSAVMSGHPLMQGIAAHAQQLGAADPVAVAMTMGLLAIGAFTYSEMLNAATGRDPDDARLRESAANMYADWFPGPTG